MNILMIIGIILGGGPFPVGRGRIFFVYRGL